MSSLGGGFSFAVEKLAGPMRKRSLHYTEAPRKNISPRTLNFSQIHHQTHGYTVKTNQGSGIYREAAIMSERLLKLSGADSTTQGLYSNIHAFILL
jgi:hypothetical protein